METTVHFEFYGRIYLRLQHTYMRSNESERTVEGALGVEFINRFLNDGGIVEVGAVMPNYGLQHLPNLYQNFGQELDCINEREKVCRQPKYVVVDMLEEWPNGLKMDAEQGCYYGRNVLSISTIEHVGHGDYGDAVEPGKAIRLLEKIRIESVNYLITFPVGSNRELEEWIERNLNYGVLGGYSLFKRVSAANEWVHCAEKISMKEFQYGNPYPWGNAVCVLTNAL